MSTIPFLNPKGADVTDFMEVVAIASANVALMATIPYLLVDLALRALNWRRVWAYAMAGGIAVYVVCGVVLMMLGPGSGPIFLVGMAFVPGAAGAAVMGLFRR
jgi:hypothetical protein